MSREHLDQWCERGILGLVLTILLFGPLATGAVSTHEFLALLLLTMGAMCLWGIRLWLTPEGRQFWPPVSWCVVGFVVYAIIRYFLCDIEYVGRLELLRILLYAFLFFVIINNLNRQQSMQALVLTMSCLGLLISSIAIWQFLASMDKVPSLGAWIESLVFDHKLAYYPRVYTNRASGTYINPNHLAGFLEMVLPLTVSYMMVSRLGILTKVFLGYAALAMITGIGVTVSRGSWIAAGTAMLFLFAILSLNRTYQRAALVAMMIIVAGSTFFILRTDFFKERLRRAFGSGKIELDTRYDLWQSTVKMWKDHRWIGVGPGHYDHRFREYRPINVQLRPDRAHNEYLNLLADWGVVGGTIVGAGLLALAVGAIGTWSSVQRMDTDLGYAQSNRYAFYLGASTALLALLIHSLVDFNLQIPANAILAVTLVALLSSQLRHVADRWRVRNSFPVRVMVSSALAGGVTWFAVQGIRLGREYYWIQLAGAESHWSLGEASKLERAYLLEANNSETTYNIGEAYRMQSSQGAENYSELATNAIVWFERGMRLNRYDHRNYVGRGWSLDWLDQPKAARADFLRAEQLDPNGYRTIFDIARHFTEQAEWAAARAWLERSLRLQRQNNPSEAWLNICELQLGRAATNSLSGSSLAP